MKRKGLILAVLAAIVAAVMGLAACNGNGDNGDTTPVQYTVTFETNGGSIVAPITVDEGGSVTLPTPEKTHFNFDGWFDNAAYNGNKLSSPYTPTANATLYAKWEAVQYTVSFETNDGNITINPVTVEGGKSVDLPTPEKTHFNFVGWFDNVDLNGDRLSSPYTPTANITLYAKWEAVRYTVTFETNGGSTVDSITIDEGGSVNLPTPKKTDFTFVGWFDNVDLNGDRQSSPYTPTANITLYAKWEAIVYTDEAYFTFEKIEDSSNTIIGYSVSLVSGTVPSNINVPASHNSKPVLTVKSLASENVNEIAIFDSVTEIESGAFSGCDNLEKITLPFVGGGALGYIIGANHFGYVFGAISYNDNSTGVPEKLKTVVATGGRIARSAFEDCSGLTSITIPNTVTSIGEDAFRDCSSLTSITIPKTVTSIGIYAFYGCSKLTSITIPDTVTSIVDSAFRNCSDLTSVTIGSGVTSIDDYAFDGCSSLTSITIPNSVTSIGENAFSGCSGLTSITIPNSVTSIGEDAFMDSGLTSVTIGSGVTAIGGWAFYNCYKLIEVYNLSSLDITAGSTTHGYVARYAGNVYTPTSGASKITTADGYIFYNGNASYYLMGYNGTDTVLTLPNDCNGNNYAIYKRAFYGCSGATSITIPDSVTSIGDYAFYNCSGLTSVTIGSKVTSIGDYAFYGCSGATSITIPDSVTSIGEYAFYNCSGLTSVTIGSGVETIDDYAFNSCSQLTSITIPDSVTSIGERAFSGCYRLIEVYNLSSLDITAGFTTHGYVAYYAKNVYKPTSGASKITTADGYMFYNGNDTCYLIRYNGTDTVLTLPNDCNGNNYAIYAYAFEDCIGLTNITIPDSVTSIGEWAFWGCSKLTSITIPDTVTSIGDGAFSGCSKLTSITFNGTIAQWKTISKGFYLANSTPSFTVECTDGTLSKSEALA